ncbi:diguanylate cyclase/phosphodiesterase (GGDEF & EAL domains) with PAS/PAC sensor(s) [hydrothermal vent metagenome]|uniref:Diguanylate cyclase/phosphodiesterase (GGDEF & EAL domains) with PAS/PAC sensor(S) n=1 Tax=hydrothermal vent metagenome TaxID=652676 RepID=A0A3B0XDU7_9ZZZZ
MNLPRLTIIDDEADLVDFIGLIAEQVNFDVEKYLDANLFMKNYQFDSDVIVLDLMMPNVDGIEVIRYLANAHCKAQLVLISGFDQSILHSAQELAKEQNLNFYGCLSKPFRAHELSEFLSNLTILPQNSPNEDLAHSPSIDEVRTAITNHELIMYYQPKIELSNPLNFSVEALVRWQHPKRGLLNPDSFIPLSEEYNLIDDMTWEILNLVLAQTQKWAAQKLFIKTAVNMSAVTLKDLNLPKKIMTLMQQYHLEPSQIVLEVTETALMEELIKSLEILTRLRMKGFELSIDDFGTGYSSLVQLHRIPFSELKIDASFVANMDQDAESLAIVETVILLGHKLGMKVVAEGVESKNNLMKLKNMNCDITQGYYNCRPQSADDITQWYMHQHV